MQFVFKTLNSKLFFMFFCSGCNPEGMDGVDAGFLEACLQESMQARHQRQSLNQSKVFSVFVLAPNFYLLTFIY